MNTNSTLPSLVYVITSLKRLFVRETMTAFRTQNVLPVLIDVAAAQFRNTLRQDILWSLNGRFERGVALAKQGAVSYRFDPNSPNKQRLFQVMSANQSRPPYAYMVDLDVDRCACPDHSKGYYCKHIIASHIYEIVSHNQMVAEVSAPSTPGTIDKLKDIQPPQSYQVQSKTIPLLNDSSLLSSEADAETDVGVQKDSVIWGVIKHGGQWLGVEILKLDDDNATIRALPKIIDGKKIQPQFPFEGKRCTITVPKKHIFHVKIFQ